MLKHYLQQIAVNSVNFCTSYHFGLRCCIAILQAPQKLELLLANNSNFLISLTLFHFASKQIPIYFFKVLQNPIREWRREAPSLSYSLATYRGLQNPNPYRVWVLFTEVLPHFCELG